MIWESKLWKEELLNSARLLRKLARQRASDRRSFQIERAIFIPAYIMRKLWEAGKLSSSWQTRVVPCVRFPRMERVPDRFNWHEIEEFYRLDSPLPEQLPAPDFCNRLIHSFVFIESVEGRPKMTSGFFFASDTSRRKGLLFVKLPEIIALLIETGRDYPSSARMVRDPKTHEWVVWAGHGDPPQEWQEMADAMSAELSKKLRTHST